MKPREPVIVRNPRIRIPTIDAGRLRSDKTSMVGLLEIDVTILRERLREMRRRGHRFSFTACIIKLIADCVAANKEVQAGLIGVKRLALFDDVDISISIERTVDGLSFPFPLIIRSANAKSVLEIDREIVAEQGRKVGVDKELFLPHMPGLGRAFLALFYSLPSRLRVRFMELMLKSPVRARQVIGTVGFATVGMTGRLSGWTFPDRNPYSLYLSLGSATKKPRVVGKEILVRDVLNMTAIFNHNVIDGTPARSFMNELVERIEKGRFEVD